MIALSILHFALIAFSFCGFWVAGSLSNELSWRWDSDHPGRATLVCVAAVVICIGLFALALYSTVQLVRLLHNAQPAQTALVIAATIGLIAGICVSRKLAERIQRTK